MIAYDFSDFSTKNHVTYFPAITKRKDIENSKNRLIITVIDLHVHTEFDSSKSQEFMLDFFNKSIIFLDRRVQYYRGVFQVTSDKSNI